MLYSIGSDNPIQGIPQRRQPQWNLWRGNIPDADYEQIAQQINDYCDTQTVFTSSFVPGQIWGDQTCQPLLDACNQSAENAGFFFGLIVWQTLIERENEWLFKLADYAEDVLGTTYWRKQEK